MNIILKDMKRLTSILLLLAFTLVAQAQIAGPVVSVVRKPDNSQTAQVGVPDASVDVCYQWTGPHIVGDPNLPVITVHPIQDTEEYVVKRISKNGVEEDLTLVILENYAEIASVTPKYGCYSQGDAISTNDFIITTDPPGYENLVTVTPATASNTLGASISTMWLTFKLTQNGHTDSTTKSIKVVNNDLDASEGISLDASDLVKSIKKCTALVNKLENMKKNINNLSFLKSVSDCEFDVDYSLNEPTVVNRKKCCSDHTVNDVLYVTFPSFSIGGGLGCRFPFYGIPHVASADVVLNLGVSFSLGPIQGELSPNTTCCTFCIPVSGTVSVSGGVGVSLGGGDLLSADLLLQGSTTATTQWCPVGDGFSIHLNGKVSVVGQVKLISFITYSIEYPLFTYYLF